MDELTYHAFHQMLGSGLTNHPIDNKLAVLALRSAQSINAITAPNADRKVVMDMIMRKRAAHRQLVTTWQRQWQNNRRTVTPRSCDVRYRRWDKLHTPEAILRAEGESIRTREKYVRCDGKTHSARGVEDFMAAL